MTATDPISRFESLSDRQKEVLRLFCQGIEYKDIGKDLFISKNTVKAHMGNIYEKLGLAELPPKKRTATIFEIYCPLLEKRPPPPVVEDEEPKPVSPKIQQMVEEDEKALVLWQPAQIIDAEVREIPPRRRRGCSRLLIWIIIIGGLFAGLFLVFGGDIFGPDDSSTPTPQQEEVADSSPEITDTPQIAAPSDTPAVIIVTATSPPSSATPLPTSTTIPSPTSKPNTPAGSILEVGEWWKKDGVWVRMREYEITDSGGVWIILEFWNKTDGTILFSWNTSGNLSLRDNNGHNYPLTSQYTNGSNNENVDAGELIDVRNGQYGYTAIFQDKALFNPGVTELILTVIDFSGIDQAQFRILINK